MKTTLLLCLVVALAGCSGNTQSTAAAQPAISKPVVKMDSPIIISDGSTRLKHKDKSGANSDFKITYNTSLSMEQMIVNDSLYTVGMGKCLNVISCPSSFTSQLVKGWTLDVRDANNADIMTVGSTDNMIVTIDFHGNFIDPKPDGSDGGNDTNDTTGTEIIQHGLKFKSALFTNGDGTTATITCSSSPCKLSIDYH